MSLPAAGGSPWSIPSKKDLEAVNEEVRALREHVGRLEEEIRALKVELMRIGNGRDNTRPGS